jgi:hypothetical protein
MTEQKFRLIALLYFQEKCLLETGVCIQIPIVEEEFAILSELVINEVVALVRSANGITCFQVSQKGVDVMNCDIETVNRHKLEFLSIARTTLSNG